MKCVGEAQGSADQINKFRDSALRLHTSRQHSRLQYVTATEVIRCNDVNCVNPGAILPAASCQVEERAVFDNHKVDFVGNETMVNATCETAL